MICPKISPEITKTRPTTGAAQLTALAQHPGICPKISPEITKTRPTTGAAQLTALAQHPGNTPLGPLRAILFIFSPNS